MDSYSILATLRVHRPAKELGYKLKDSKMQDWQLWRWTPEGWRDHYTPNGAALTDAQLLTALEMGIIGGYCLVIFDCCCADCLPPQKREWTREWAKLTRLHVSHGYAPECHEKMMAQVRAECAK